MRTLEQLGISPAPWVVCNLYPAVNSINGEDVCDLSDNENKSADARLIAAAPELYEAFARLVDFLDRECVPCGNVACELMTVAHAALAKAGGEEAEK